MEITNYYDLKLHKNYKPTSEYSLQGFKIYRKEYKGCERIRIILKALFGFGLFENSFIEDWIAALKSRKLLAVKSQSTQKSVASVSKSSTTVSSQTSPQVTPPQRQYATLDDLHAHFENTLDEFHKLANTIQPSAIDEHDSYIMKAKASLADPLAHPIDEQNLLEWKKVLDKLWEAEKLLNAKLLNHLAPLAFGFHTRIAKHTDKILPCLSEAFYLTGDVEVAESIIEKMLCDLEVKYAFYLKFAEHYLAKDNREKALEAIGKFNGDKKIKENFVAKVAESYLTAGQGKEALETAQKIVYDKKLREQLMIKIARNYRNVSLIPNAIVTSKVSTMALLTLK